MVGTLVRFLFTCCEESQTHSLEDSLVRLRFFTTRELKSYALTNHEVIYIYRLVYWENVKELERMQVTLTSVSCWHFATF